MCGRGDDGADVCGRSFGRRAFRIFKCKWDPDRFLKTIGGILSLKLFKILPLFLLFILFGCNEADTPQGQDEIMQESDEGAPLLDEGEVEDNFIISYNLSQPQTELIFPRLEQQFPELNFEYLHNASHPMQETEADLYIAESSRLISFIENDPLFDLERYAKDERLSLAHIPESLILTGSGGEIYAVPYIRNMFPVLYNKEIFDYFDVPHPEDGMTWDEVIELSKKVTGKRGDQTVLGFVLGNYYDLLSQMSASLIDPNGRAAVNTEEWSRAAHILKGLYAENPGNIPVGDKNNILYYYTSNFFTDQNIAMDTTLDLLSSFRTNDFEWDIFSYPVFPEYPDTGPFINTTQAAVHANSTMQEAALAVVNYLISEEHSIDIAEHGIIPGKITDEVIQNFAIEIPDLNDKNKAALFYHTPGPSPIPAPFDEQVSAMTTAADETMLGIASGEKEVEPALKELEEKVNQLLHR